MTLKLTILGCGNSAGAPTIGNYWGKCDPNEPRNIRLRPSVCIQSEATTIVVDTGPDFKQQVNRAGLKDVDAILYTHGHSDHTHGIDDLRVYRQLNKRVIDIFANHDTISELKSRFSYLFMERHSGIYPKVLEDHVIADEDFYKPFNIKDIEIVPYLQDHGTCRSMGYRFGEIAYSTDMVDLGQESLEALKGIKTWVVDAAAYNISKNMVHANLGKIYAFNEIIGAEKVYITHMPVSMDYQTLCAELPEGYEPAYDGLEIAVQSSVVLSAMHGVC